MTKKELDREIKRLRKLRKEVCSSKETAQDFFHKAGILTKSGKLRKVYR